MSFRISFKEEVKTAKEALESVESFDGGKVEVRQITEAGEVSLTVKELKQKVEEEKA